jgi:Spy/CpxP family protein refolding chaperone
MKRTIAIVYVVGLFLLGIVVGALGMHVADRHFLHHPHPPATWGHGARGAGFPHIEAIAGELGLDKSQQLKIQDILTDSRHEAHQLHEEMLPRVHELMDQTHERINEVLTPEQRERLNELLANHRGGFERLFLGRGSGDPRRGRGRPRGNPGAE